MDECVAEGEGREEEADCWDEEFELREVGRVVCLMGYCCNGI